MKSVFFLNMKKMRIEILRWEHWTRAPDHWYGHFGSKLCFWKFVKKCQKYQNWINFGYIPDGPKKLWKFVKHLENVGSEPCAWPLGYGRWLDSSTPQVLALRRSLRGFFFRLKQRPKKNNACLLIKWTIYVDFCYFGKCWLKFEV